MSSTRSPALWHAVLSRNSGEYISSESILQTSFHVLQMGGEAGRLSGRGVRKLEPGDVVLELSLIIDPLEQGIPGHCIAAESADLGQEVLSGLARASLNHSVGPRKVPAPIISDS